MQKVKAALGDALPEGAADLEAWISARATKKPRSEEPPPRRQRLCPKDLGLAEFLGEWGFEGEKLQSFSVALADKLGKSGSFASY